MRRAADATIAEDSKDQGSRGHPKISCVQIEQSFLRNPKRAFTAEEFQSVTRSHFFMGAVSFWREVERLTQPEETIRVYARGVLRTMAESEYRDCRGLALSPQHAEALTFCGLTPLGVRPPGSLGRGETA